MPVPIRLVPTGARAWKALLARWTAAAVLLAGLGVYMTRMPGHSYRGAPQPLSAQEAALRGRLCERVAMLADLIGVRNVWTVRSLDRAAEYIEEAFRRCGPATTRQEFTAQGRQVCNVELLLEGTRPDAPALVVGAHYDTFGKGRGANDNASGVAVLLEVAGRLCATAHERTIRLVAFVNEEPPFFGTSQMGSFVYASALHSRGQRLVGMLSLETMGCYSDEPKSQSYPFVFALFYPHRGNFIAFVGNMSSHGLTATAVRLFRDRCRFPSEGVAAPGWLKGIGWSDHWSFWKNGYQALMITDTAPYRYAHYHQASDTGDKLDYDRMARVSDGVCRVVEQLAMVGESHD